MISLVYHGLIRANFTSDAIAFYERIYKKSTIFIGNISMEYIIHDKSNIVRGLCEFEEKNIKTYGIFTAAINFDTNQLFTTLSIIKSLDWSSVKMFYDATCSCGKVIYNGLSDRVQDFNILSRLKFAYMFNDGFVMMIFSYPGSEFSYIVINLINDATKSLFRASGKNFTHFINKNCAKNEYNFFFNQQKSNSTKIFAPLFSLTVCNEWATKYNLKPMVHKNNIYDISLKNDTGDKCCICCVNVKTHAFIPCGHKAICEQCCNNRYENCPLCRAPYNNIIKIYN